MKIACLAFIVFFFSAVSCHASQSNGTVPEYLDSYLLKRKAMPGLNYWKDMCVPLFINARYVKTEEQYRELFRKKMSLGKFVGKQFPVYCGYLTLGPGRKLHFTPKTDLPLLALTDEIDSLVEGRPLPATFIQQLHVGSEAVYPDHDLFFQLFFQLLYDMGVERGYEEDLTEEDMKHFTPILEEPCTFRKLGDCPRSYGRVKYTLAK